VRLRGWPWRTPFVFSLLRSSPAAFADGAERVLVDVDEAGLVHISANFKSRVHPQGRGHSVIVFDGNSGYRVVEHTSSQENMNGDGPRDNYELHVDWRNHGPGWYVAKVTSDQDATRVDFDGNTRKALKRRYAVTVDIDKFDPQANVEDSEFTLDSLGAPAGTKVVDKVAGITYAYGVPEVGETDLETLFRESHLAKSRVFSLATHSEATGRDMGKASGVSGAGPRLPLVFLVTVALAVAAGSALLLRKVFADKLANK